MVSKRPAFVKADTYPICCRAKTSKEWEAEYLVWFLIVEGQTQITLKLPQGHFSPLVSCEDEDYDCSRGDPTGRNLVFCINTLNSKVEPTDPRKLVEGG